MYEHSLASLFTTFPRGAFLMFVHSPASSRTYAPICALAQMANAAIANTDKILLIVNLFVLYC